MFSPNQSPLGVLDLPPAPAPPLPAQFHLPCLVSSYLHFPTQLDFSFHAPLMSFYGFPMCFFLIHLWCSLFPNLSPLECVSYGDQRLGLIHDQDSYKLWVRSGTLETFSPCKPWTPKVSLPPQLPHSLLFTDGETEVPRC